MRRRRPPPPSDAVSALIAELARAPALDHGKRWMKAGDVIGRFELVRELGRGGFGVVWEAVDLELRRRVAFKAIRPGPSDWILSNERLLQQEAIAVAQLQHPNIVTLYDAGASADGPYLILELLRGETLSGRIRRGPVPLRAAVRIGVAVTRALVHAHAHGVLHRDLKPGNVFLVEGGGVKVLDFGLAHLFGAGGPARSGTPGYMAPEQRRGDAEDARTDLFALGALLYEMLSGRRAVPGARLDAQGKDDPGAPLFAPPALAGLVARLLEPEPARRPAAAAEVLGALLRVERSLSAERLRARGRAWIGAAAVAIAAAALSRIPSCAPAAPRVAVADAQNETGDPELGGISSMLASSLEESSWLALVPRSRLLRAAAGSPDAPETVGCARLVAVAGKLGIGVVLCPEVRRVAGTTSVDVVVRAVDPRAGAQAFSTAGRAEGARTVPDVLDDLSERIRRALGEPEDAVRRRRLDIARGLTPDLEAYRHYVLGAECAARPVVGQDCGAEFRKAAARDPGFALAHYQLAVWSYWNGGSPAEQQAALARAVAQAERAPTRDRALIGAWSAYLAGRLDEALRRYEDVARRWPEDPHAWIQIADIRRRRAVPGAAIPALERAVDADPGSPWAAGYLAECLGASGQLDRLRERIHAWEAAPSPATLHALSIGWGWLGDARRAAIAAERGEASGGGLLAHEDRVAAVVFAGDPGAAEAILGAVAAPGSAARPLGFYGLAAIDAYRGRRRAGLARLDALGRELPAIRSDSLYRTLRVDYVLGDGDPQAAWREIVALRAVDPSGAAEHAAGLAWLGDLEHARELAAVRPGSPYARTYEAIAAWRAGDVDGALDGLRALSRTVPCATWRVPPVYLLAEVAAASGRDAEAVEAIARFHAMYVPRTMWRSWAYPRSLVLLARSQARLGETARARETLDRFLAAWATAEPGAPLLEEARTLRAALARLAGRAVVHGSASRP